MFPREKSDAGDNKKQRYIARKSTFFKIKVFKYLCNLLENNAAQKKVNQKRIFAY